MKYALINGERSEATKGPKGLCPLCKSEVIAKCGEVYVNYWSHRGKRNCDPWLENETDWHRSWKDSFPREWQEIVHFAENGEKHIADVKTETGWILEFQHSFLKPDERRSRNAFYPKLAWVVNGSRRPTDKIQFEKAVKESSAIINNPPILRVLFPEECRVLKEWHDSNALVFFDFQEMMGTNQSMLWFLFPKIADTEAYLSPFLRLKFIELHKANKFDEMVSSTILPIQKELSNGFLNRRKMIEYGPQNMAYNFQHDLAIMRMKQRRFRF